jgi:hypothetical protein
MTPRCLKHYLAVGPLLFVLATVSNGQSQKTIEWSEHPQGSDVRDYSGVPPLQVVKQVKVLQLEEIRVDAASVAIGKSFAADADWLRNITFRVRNISSESLSFVQITLTLPQLGSRIQIPYLGCDRKQQICLKPGEDLELRLPAGGLYDWVKKSAEDQHYEISAIDTATIRFVIADLPNGTQLSSGCVKTTTASHPCPGTP